MGASRIRGARGSPEATSPVGIRRRATGHGARPPGPVRRAGGAATDATPPERASSVFWLTPGAIAGAGLDARPRRRPDEG